MNKSFQLMALLHRQPNWTFDAFISAVNCHHFTIYEAAYCKQEAQLMLINPHNAFRGQSRSPNLVPFHMLGIFLLAP